jgi:PAS domain S-box-containing protein
MAKKILVVDNHPVVLKFMTELLEKEGHQVKTAETGLDALDILRNFIPDVIFVDLIMPNIDGKKFCQIIRKIPELKDVFLIVLSAIAAEQNVNFTEFGANACIAKAPFNKMAKYIHAVMDQLSLAPGVSLSDQVIGFNDVFPRHITEELLFVKRHFEAILGTMSEGILEITSEGRIVYANPAAIALIGILEEKLLASNFTDQFKQTDAQMIKDQLMAINNQSKTIIRDFPVLINGKQILLNILPVTDERHRTIIIILNDVSERKWMEAQLLQAQKMEAIGTLAGGIAHDFNNLLMVIQGNASLMLLNVDPSHPHYEMLLSIEKQVQSGSKLTNQLLGYARKGKYEIKVIQLNQLVEETSKTFGRTRKEITIHRELADNLFSIEGDPGQIEQVLMNLFVNAADAMPEGGDLFLKTRNTSHWDIKGKLYQPTPGDYVLLTIADTGIGMDTKTLERIFDPFFTTKELGRGTGLGLASVYGIIKGHDGYIAVESEKGQGTTFRIYLPASSGKVLETVKMPDLLVKGTGTILLVDDEELVLEVGKGFLKVMGYIVLTAQGGREALETYKKHQDAIALVILDIVMPSMKGGEVFDRLKEINPDVKVLLSTGYSIDGEATKILERGGKGFIQKPFDIKQLSQSIRAVLEK